MTTAHRRAFTDPRHRCSVHARPTAAVAVVATSSTVNTDVTRRANASVAASTGWTRNPDMTRPASDIGPNTSLLKIGISSASLTTDPTIDTGYRNPLRHPPKASETVAIAAVDTITAPQ